MEKFKINRFLTLSLTTAISLVASASFAESQDGSTFGSQIIDAADHGDISQVQYLISSGSNPNDRGEFGTTPLMRAVYKNNLQLVNVLLSSGATADIKDIGGATAAMIAAREGHNEILQTLIQHGANVNTRDNEGFTPLMRASLAGNQIGAQALIANGAKVNLANSFGETALSQAKAENKLEIASLLTQHGANDAIAELPPKAKAVAQPKIRTTEVADNDDKADINVDFSGNKITHATAQKPQIRQIAQIQKPQYYVGSFYVPNKNSAPVAIDDDSDQIPIPQKPIVSQSAFLLKPRTVEVDQKWLADVGKITKTAIRPYQLASDNMIVPGTQNNIIDLGNFKNADFANKKLAKIKQAFPDTFASLPIKVVQKNSGSNAAHMYYQINAGIVSSDQEAKDLCKKFVAAGINCRPSPTNLKSQDEFNSYSGDPLPATTQTAKTEAAPADKDLLGAVPSPKVEAKSLAAPAPVAAATKPSTSISNKDVSAKPSADSFAMATPLPTPATKQKAAVGKAANIGSFASVDEFESLRPAEGPAVEPAQGQAVVVEPKKDDNQPADSAPITKAATDDATPAPTKSIAQLPPISSAITPAPAEVPSLLTEPTPIKEAKPATTSTTTVETKTTEVKPTETKSVTATTTVETKPIAPAAVETKPVEAAKPVATTTVETKTTEVTPVSPTAVETKTTEKREVIAEEKPQAKPAEAAATENIAPVPKPVKKKKIIKKPIPAAGQGTPPRDLATGQALSINPADGKFEVSRPVKAADSIADVAPSWIKIDHFNNSTDAHKFLNDLKSANPSLMQYHSKVSAPFTMPERTTAQLGPFTNQAEIDALCAAITQSGYVCTTVKSSSSRLIDSLPTANQMATIPNYDQGGNWQIQLGSYDTYDAAQDVWNEYAAQDRHLKKMKSNIVASDGKFRLRAGAFSSSAKADSLCDELRAKSISCIIIKN